MYLQSHISWVRGHSYFREETLHAIYQCEHTHIISEETLNAVSCGCGVIRIFLTSTIIFLYAVCRGYDYIQTILKLLWKRYGWGHSHDVHVRASILTKTPIGKAWGYGHPQVIPCEFQGDTQQR